MPPIITRGRKPNDFVHLDPFQTIRNIHWGGGNFYCQFSGGMTAFITPLRHVTCAFAGDSGIDFTLIDGANPIPGVGIPADGVTGPAPPIVDPPTKEMLAYYLAWSLDNVVLIGGLSSYFVTWVLYVNLNKITASDFSATIDYADVLGQTCSVFGSVVKKDVDVSDDSNGSAGLESSQSTAHFVVSVTKEPPVVTIPDPT